MSRFVFLIILSCTTLLTACSDSSDPVPEPPIEVPTPPTETPPPITNTTGVITGFGSVFVNGVEYETDSTQVSTDDNDNASEDDLQVGMIITLSGTVNEDGSTGTADTIHYQEQVKGPLESIDLEAGTMTVFGQNITFDELTNFENLTLAELNIGDFLEISGFFNNNETLYASRIEKEDNVATLKLEGVISMLDTNTQTFKLNDVVINYSTALFDEMTEQDLANDLTIRVKGDSAALVDGVFTATEIKREEREEQHDEGDIRHLEGIITEFTSNEQFIVNDTKVITTSETEFEHGTLDSLALDVRVNVKGSFDADDNLVAQEIRIQQQTDLKLEGLVQATDLELQTVTVLDVVFTVSDQTKMKDDSDDDERYFDLADLVIDDFVEVKGFVDTDGTNIATKLERKNRHENQETELKGPVSNIDGFTFSVVDVQVFTTETTLFEGDNGDDLNQTQFFDQLVDTMHVEVKGQVVDNIFTATKVEVKNRNDDEDHGDGGDGNDGDDDNGNNDGDHDRQTEFRGTIETIGENSLTVSGHEVLFTDETKYEVDDEELSAEQFWALAKIGDQAKVKGTVNDQNIITAKSVELEIAHQGNVAKIEIKGSGQLVDEKLMVSDHQVEFNSQTTFKGMNGHMSHEAFLMQATAWESFKVEGTLRDNMIIADKIEQHDNDDNEIEISAFIEEMLDSGVIVAGHTATFNEETKFYFGDEQISKSDFMNQASSNTQVKLMGMLSDEQLESIVTKSITIKDDD